MQIITSVLTISKLTNWSTYYNAILWKYHNTQPGSAVQ